MEKPSIVELMSGIDALRSDTPVLDSAYLEPVHNLFNNKAMKARLVN